MISTINTNIQNVEITELTTEQHRSVANVETLSKVSLEKIAELLTNTFSDEMDKLIRISIILDGNSDDGGAVITRRDDLTELLAKIDTFYKSIGSVETNKVPFNYTSKSQIIELLGISTDLLALEKRFVQATEKLTKDCENIKSMGLDRMNDNPKALMFLQQVSTKILSFITTFSNVIVSSINEITKIAKTFTQASTA